MIAGVRADAHDLSSKADLAGPTSSAEKKLRLPVVPMAGWKQNYPHEERISPLACSATGPIIFFHWVGNS